MERRFVVGGVLLCAFALAVGTTTVVDLSTFQLNHQDRWLLLCQAVMLIVIGERLRGWSRPLKITRSGLAVTTLIVIGFCYLGHYWILSGYDLSRDEQMAVFDAEIFSSGRLVQPLPPFWQQHVAALNTLFMLPVERPIAWVSAYLPVNAMLRAVVGIVVDPAFTGPLLTAGGLLALYKCARQLWPGDTEAAPVALLLYLTSSQILFAGMTAYAMPAHLTFNLVWLWLFLLRRRIGDLGAVATGFVATGLHQPIFHPLFVVPFMVILLQQRAWARLAFYSVGYALICAFWLAWPHWSHALVTGPNSIAPAGGVDAWSRFELMLSESNDGRWVDMDTNLLRLVAWQGVLFLPLMVAGIVAAHRDRMMMALLATILLPIALMALIMPFQGNGFGYRYLHGVLGSGILLAVGGWRRLSLDRKFARSLLLRGAVATLVVTFPLQLWMAYRSYGAFAQVEKQVAQSGADYFVVGGSDTSFSNDLVINRPDLSNRPIRFFAEALREPFIGQICASRPRIGLPATALYRSIDRYFLAEPDPTADRRIAQLMPELEAAGCRVILVGRAE